MDDFIIIHHDNKYLKECLSKIIYLLESKYKLKINEKKTEIKKSNEWNEFLGYRFKIINNKTVFTLRKESIIRIKKRIKELKYLYQNHKVEENTIFTYLFI